ncbi:hypothetical protein QTP70_015695, partial [Hemibagrus guttatus]
PFRGGLAGVFWIIVLLQNPSSLQLEVTNLPIYQSGKGYKAISKALGLPRTTVRAIIYKWQKHGTVENLPRSDRPTKKLPQERSDNSSRRSQKTLQQHPKNCRPHLPQLRQKAAAEQKEHKGSSQFCQKNILMIPKTFGKILCGLTRQKLNFLEGLCPITSGVKVTLHFRKRTSYQQ